MIDDRLALWVRLGGIWLVIIVGIEERRQEKVEGVVLDYSERGGRRVPS